MFSALILLLIYICLIVAMGWLVLWVLGQLGIPLPAQVIKILWVVVGLICLLMIWNMIGPAISVGRLPS